MSTHYIPLTPAEMAQLQLRSPELNRWANNLSADRRVLGGYVHIYVRDLIAQMAWSSSSAALTFSDDSAQLYTREQGREIVALLHRDTILPTMAEWADCPFITALRTPGTIIHTITPQTPPLFTRTSGDFGPLTVGGLPLAPKLSHFLATRAPRLVRRWIRLIFQLRSARTLHSNYVVEFNAAMVSIHNAKTLKSFIASFNQTLRNGSDRVRYVALGLDVSLVSYRFWESVAYAIRDVQCRRRDRKAAEANAPKRTNMRAELEYAEKKLYELNPSQWTKEQHWILPLLAKKNFAPGQCFGVEIEFVMESSGTDDCGDDEYSFFTGRDLATAIPGARLTYDGSVESLDEQACNPDGEEIGIVISRQNPERLRSLCAFLDRRNATANKSCGLHVHLDMRDTDRDGALKRAYRLRDALPWLVLLQPRSRREGNNYCRMGMSESDRYHMVNFTAYDEHKTVEVRLGAGTTDFRRIWFWAELLYFVTRNHFYIRTWEDFLVSSCPDDVKEWAVQRYNYFARAEGRYTV